MTSNQPYLLRAFYDWIVDNNLTPYIVVDATVPGTQVPQEHVKDGQIVLNISPSACGKLQLGNVDVSFEARFGGVPRILNVPCRAVLAIYARENGAGTVFTVEDEMDAEETPTPAPAPVSASDQHSEGQSRPPAKGRPNLKVIK
ncbi:ClpXP protease specificity-enhancing factor [Aestuariibacter halophilus]|uniref:ClpXP protease specificity-enhancing factor n=1 Tax=Fluctibacter halophilus TaxID=226011 RepID=A0ABS8GCC7_9ALTE|nr:ClpXP protease specificity-enhancing factor [Aestuariibacter halophilus]MCC2617766.1 ClpXP protease specificity-enhancing factor [Aestuariibacter halophilus]